MKKIRAALVPALCGLGLLGGCASAPPSTPAIEQPSPALSPAELPPPELPAAPPPAAGELPKIAFKEIWGYLLRGREDAITEQQPLTDIGYFAANLTDEGRITGTIPRPQIVLADGSKPRVHLVIAALSSPALMHFALSPDYGVRPLLINDICRVSQDFDGVQIDFEAVSRADAQSFWDFLKDLKARLPAGKILSVAVPARTGEVFDAYLYSKIAQIADRVIIMAYDEHWSGGAPGPVASLPWCIAVADYALSVIDPSKIIMGIPLYGRAWQDVPLARALGFGNVEDILAEEKARPSYESDLGPFFEYSREVHVKVYYEDERSLREKLEAYSSHAVGGVAFWRLGLGPGELWDSIETAAQAQAARAEAELGFPADSQY